MKKTVITICILFISGIVSAQGAVTKYGSQALQNNTGANNSAFGNNALFNNTSAFSNNAFGSHALHFNTTGSANVAMGHTALQNNTTGSHNVGIGHAALGKNNTGIYNTGMGYAALYGNSIGNNNLALGFNAGRYTNSGLSNYNPNNSIFIGYDARALTNGHTNEIVIGASARGEGSNTVVLGNDNIVKTLLKGNVGIGTTLANNPNNYLLAVNGTIGAKAIKVENTSTTWPDFVFTESYVLPSLTEVESYIQTNGHLEGIPSASEVKTEGIDIEKMNANLLQKVEELTLYVIELNKEIENLKAQ